MADGDPLSDIISTIYDAAVDPSCWQHVLDELVYLTGARKGVLHISDREGYAKQLLHNLPPSFYSDSELIHSQNIWMERGRCIPPGRAISGDQLIDPDELRRTPFYDQFLRRYDTTQLCGLTFFSDARWFGAVSLLRGARDRRFGKSELRMAQRVAVHLAKATRIAILLENQKLYSTQLEDTAHHLAFGLLLLRADGRLVFANRETERLLQEADLFVRNGRLRVAKRSGGPTFEELLARAVSTGEAQAKSIFRRAGSPLQMLIVPVRKREGNFGIMCQAQIMVMIVDACNQGESLRRIIRQLYGLTQAELRLIEGLQSGQSPSEYADSRRLSRNTVKTQLRSVYAKTGFRRQSELSRHLQPIATIFREKR